MLTRQNFASLTGGLVLALVAASCGGSTRNGDGSGGSSSGAGASGSGGSGAAGSGGAGGSSGVNGAGGSAGVPARCSLPSESGNCNAYFPAYFHNPKTGVCEPFVFGGCGGNDNRFSTREECQAACRGGTPDMDACSHNSECVIVEFGCCGGCGQTDGHGFVSVSRRDLETYSRLRACNVTCGACPMLDELETTSQYFAPSCQAGACTVVDIREMPVTGCATAADCQLREGAQCCSGCDGQGLVSVSVRSEEFFNQLCADFTEGCPPCGPQIPPEFVPACTDGRCRVTRLTR